MTLSLTESYRQAETAYYSRSIVFWLGLKTVVVVDHKYVQAGTVTEPHVGPP